MPKKIMVVEWKDGAKLSQSKKSPGHASPLTRDGDNKLGHVILSEVDEHEDHLLSEDDQYVHDARAEEERLALNIAIAEAIIEALVVAAPHIWKWWLESAHPAIKSSRNSRQIRKVEKREAKERETKGAVRDLERASRTIESILESMHGRKAKRREAKRTIRDLESASRSIESTIDSMRIRETIRQETKHPDHGLAVVTLEGVPIENSSTDSGSALADQTPVMTQAEAQQCLNLAVIARLFSDEQIRKLLSSRIEDAGSRPGLNSPMTLTPEELAGYVHRMLEGSPALLDDFAMLFQSKHLSETPNLVMEVTRLP